MGEPVLLRGTDFRQALAATLELKDRVVTKPGLATRGFENRPLAHAGGEHAGPVRVRQGNDADKARAAPRGWDL